MLTSWLKPLVGGLSRISRSTIGGWIDDMQKFVKIAVIEPKIAKVPFTLDASKFDIVTAGLKWC